MDIIIKLGIEKAEALFISSSWFKQGDNLAPVLFLFSIQPSIDIMNWSCTAKKLSEPELEYFLNESNGFLNKRSQKTGTCLSHKDTFYANNAAFTFLSKDNFIIGTIFIQNSFAQFGLEVHLGHCSNNLKSKTEVMYLPSHSKLKKEILEEVEILISLTIDLSCLSEKSNTLALT